MTMKKYIITASCNPYNAHSHYNGQRVLRYDMTTPTLWVNDDDYGDGYSLEEAMDILDSYANQLNDDTSFCDDEWIEQLRKEVKEDYGDDLDTSWYVGEGWYANNSLVYKRGDMYLQDDVVTYSIADIEDYPLPSISKREASIHVAKTYIDYASEYEDYDDIEGLIEALTIISNIDKEKVFANDVERYLNPYLDQLKEFLDEQ